MVKLLLLTGLLLPTLTHAKEEAIVCPLYFYKEVKAKAEARDSYDKFKHCAVSCMLSLRCPITDVIEIGLLKEGLDYLGYGSPEVADMEANMSGIRLVTKKKVKTDKACLDSCQLLHRPNSC